MVLYEAVMVDIMLRLHMLVQASHRYIQFMQPAQIPNFDLEVTQLQEGSWLFDGPPTLDGNAGLVMLGMVS